MNVNVHLLDNKQIKSEPDIASRKFAIEDNIGESIHIHYRNMRYEFTVNEFQKFGELIESASKELEFWEDNGYNQ